MLATAARQTRTRLLITVMLALPVAVSWRVTTQAPPPVAAPGPQYELAGNWIPIVHEDATVRAVGGEYTGLQGLPVNDAARLRYETYSENQTGQPEFQCRRDIADYGMRGAHATLWITSEFAPDTHQIVAFKLHFRPSAVLSGYRTIYLDSRPRPSAMARHSWTGFSSATWDGNMLNVETSHFKQFFLYRPGVPGSDERTWSEHWVRHGDLLTMAMVIRDPVFLTEPLVWSQTWARTSGPQPVTAESFCHAVPELVGGERQVPFHLPGTNPSISEPIRNYGLNDEVVRGGAELMYPEYRKRMKQTASTLEYCKRRCGEGPLY